MIARIWKARSSAHGANLYAAHFRNHVLIRLERMPGYFGGVLLRSDDDSECELTVITIWNDLEVIKQFAGTDINRAVVADDAAAVLTDFDSTVNHARIVDTDIDRWMERSD